MENFLEQIKNTASRFSDKKQAIIVGGGEVNTSRFTNLDQFLVININDSMFKVSGDIAIVKSRRALKHILEADLKKDQRLFIIPKDIIEDEERIEFKRLIVIDDLTPFFKNEFNLFNNMAIFGIEIAKACGFSEMWLTGFTFDAKDYTGDNHKYNKVYFQQQKEMLNRYSDLNSELEISILRPRLKDRTPKTLESVIHERLSNNETIIVAEFTNNHLGELDTLLSMVTLAKEQGADLIKIQKRDVDNFYTDEEKAKPYTSKYGDTLYDYRKGVELSHEMLEIFDQHCRIQNIPWFSTVLDVESLRKLEGIKEQKLIKLPSTISNFKNYLTYVSDHYPEDFDLVVSTGATDMEYVEWVLDHFYNGKRNLFLLHTLSAYPTPLEDINVGVINLYKKLQEKYPKLYPGYSGHDIGSFGTQLAVAAGAMMVEKHVKLEDNEWIHFDGVAVSLKDGEFEEYVKAVRKADACRGREEKIVHSIEHHKYDNATDKVVK